MEGGFRLAGRRRRRGIPAFGFGRLLRKTCQFWRHSSPAAFQRGFSNLMSRNTAGVVNRDRPNLATGMPVTIGREREPMDEMSMTATKSKASRLSAQAAETGAGASLTAALRSRFGLSRMEATVACALADGLTYQEIADRCGI